MGSIREITDRLEAKAHLSAKKKEESPAYGIVKTEEVDFADLNCGRICSIHKNVLGHYLILSQSDGVQELIVWDSKTKTELLREKLGKTNYSNTRFLHGNLILCDADSRRPVFYQMHPFKLIPSCLRIDRTSLFTILTVNDQIKLISCDNESINIFNIKASEVTFQNAYRVSLLLPGRDINHLYITGIRALTSKKPQIAFCIEDYSQEFNKEFIRIAEVNVINNQLIFGSCFDVSEKARGVMCKYVYGITSLPDGRLTLASNYCAAPKKSESEAKSSEVVMHDKFNKVICFSEGLGWEINYSNSMKTIHESDWIKCENLWMFPYYVVGTELKSHLPECAKPITTLSTLHAIFSPSEHVFYSVMVGHPHKYVQCEVAQINFRLLEKKIEDVILSCVTKMPLDLAPIVTSYVGLSSQLLEFSLFSMETWREATSLRCLPPEEHLDDEVVLKSHF